MKASGRILEIITRGQHWRLNVKHKGRLTIIPGTIPIIVAGRVIGGIGHSGESAENDLKIAQAGLAAVYREDSFDVGVEPLLSRARMVAEEAMRIASSLGSPASIAVVDEWGELILLYRMDGAPYGTLELARDKAWTAATMMASGRMLEVITRGQGWRLNVKHKGRLTVIPGTIPVISHARVIGGVGHSGGSAEDDMKIAQAGWAAMYREDEFEVEVEERLARARKIALEAMKYIEEKALKPSSIAVVDEGGELVLLYRMDGAPYGTLELARDKAWTAAAFKTPSEEATSFTLGDHHSVNWNERFTPVPGGLPFTVDGKPSGALGICGNKPEEDKEIALAALKRAGLA